MARPLARPARSAPDLQCMRGRAIEGAEDVVEAENAVAVGSAAAFEGHVDVAEAEAGGGVAGKGVRAAEAAAAKVDQGGDAVAALGGFELFGVGWLLR